MQEWNVLTSTQAIGIENLSFALQGCAAVSRTLRPVDLARAAGVSTQSVREYERLGFLPPAARSPSGHRRYGQPHLDAIMAARTMQAGYGWFPCLTIMRCVHAGDLPAAIELVHGQHAALAAERRRIDETHAALTAALNGIDSPLPRSRRDGLQIGEVARLAGVRASALHFWEHIGLLRPQRGKSSRYRLYDQEQLRKVQIIVLLRRAGYRPERIGEMLAAIGEGRPEAALAALDRHRIELNERGRLCVAATAAFWEYVSSGRGDENSSIERGEQLRDPGTAKEPA
jgi:DNA-binding transcriptional MerR regulator